MSVCLSNDRLYASSWSLTQIYRTLCCKEIPVSQKIRVLSSGTVCQILTNRHYLYYLTVKRVETLHVEAVLKCCSQRAYILKLLWDQGISQIPWWWLGVTVSVVGRINEVNQHRARLVPGWVTVSGLANHLGV